MKEQAKYAALHDLPGLGDILCQLFSLGDLEGIKAAIKMHPNLIQKYHVYHSLENHLINILNYIDKFTLKEDHLEQSFV